ncbi:rhodanese-like domain-containing protein [Gordonia soli]|uniref:Rhodanese domain-containing protein n=1 Tax=Gordonia soli NBRC 108243 TaxID=1223545 RepID=M0QKD8_9ACTN|nr:rhodanese-like domain-containing protein [Gordonia soli]GAC69110.1 hypothetical protein GS4_20_01760 [Gordonia soli NBRC 108243]
MSVVDSISAADVVDHVHSGFGVVVDARPQVVRHQGSLPGAYVVEPGEIRAAFAPGSAERLAQCQLDTEIAVVSVRSEAARIAEQIAALGYTNVRYVDGGFFALRTASSV